MVRRDNGWPWECVLLDLNTQRDFCLAEGASPVANRDQLLPALRRVIAWTKRNQVPVISSLNSHRPFEVDGKGPHPCCIEGSWGQKKLPFTVFPQHYRVDVDNTLAVPTDLFRMYQQIVFRERGEDLLTNPKAERFLTQLPARETIVFGNGLENSVKVAALGLRARDKRVTVILDACGYWNREEADFAVRLLAAKGIDLVTVDELRRRKLSRCHRYGLHLDVGSPRTGAGRNGSRVRVLVTVRSLRRNGKGNGTVPPPRQPSRAEPGSGGPECRRNAP
ncbi:MAG TPA: isochorismatase family protein [Phycisphaerae bacterium]|nr:isochorismatase family protein [Phycisphaerae bacterium]HNU43803.1 isochorismatase family protein [Phycisphaerae bacterium]